MRPSGARSRSARASSRRTTACSTELHVRAAGTPVAMQIRRRDALCLGESTAESGPRCDEAEEARRRPALTSFVGAKRGRWIPGGFKRRSVAIAPPSFFVDPPGTIRYGFRLVVGGTIPPATYGRWTYRRPYAAASFACGDPQVAGKTPKRVTGWRQVGLLSSIPFILALAPIIGFVIGQLLDRHFRTRPWLSIILLVLGFVAGVRETIKIVKLSQQED
ncbi:MAG: AtpZ/AtpI family protein [Candidatus Eisenbacteria bacterium]|uniref:AtpZ/AtpI family protein n=1 Tax=Eiseniibacteriota bacterium TaxID=2212470 RepID=A0A538T3E7_UNCEI|nr:MAG: AtpZ/AtpI family protein [Candidatus Eisenbacteria bacterium]